MKSIPLTQGLVTVVDEEDFPKLNVYKWYATKAGRECFYAVRNAPTEGGGRRLLYLHRFLLGEPPSPGLEVNHINGDRLDNRRKNLEWVTHAQNTRSFQRPRISSASRYRGVTWYPRKGMWRAQVLHCGRAIHIGYYSDETQAAKAFDSKIRALGWPKHGLNFPE